MWGTAYILSQPGRAVGTEHHRSCVIVGIYFQIFGYCTAFRNNFNRNALILLQAVKMKL